MMKHDNLDLTPVGQSNTSEEVLMETGRCLLCLLYGAKFCTTMAEVRHMLFTTKREKCSNLHSLLPTGEARTHHMKWAHLKAMSWKAADEQQPSDVSAEDYGWHNRDGVPYSEQCIGLQHLKTWWKLSHVDAQATHHVVISIAAVGVQRCLALHSAAAKQRTSAAITTRLSRCSMILLNQIMRMIWMNRSLFWAMNVNV